MNIAIILAGGLGLRVGADIPKQFIKIQNKPVLAYTLEIFEKNPLIDAIEIVCHKDWVNKVNDICNVYGVSKKRWICNAGESFQESVLNGIENLRAEADDGDIVVISFAVSPMTPQEDIDDSIKICREHGNAIASREENLCTCIKTDEEYSTQNILREEIKCFANPWSFRYGELREAYEEALRRGILDDIEPHTTSLYFALGKRIWFSQSTAVQSKITTKGDLDLFEGYLLLKAKHENNLATN